MDVFGRKDHRAVTRTEAGKTGALKHMEDLGVKIGIPQTTEILSDLTAITIGEVLCVAEVAEVAGVVPEETTV